MAKLAEDSEKMIPLGVRFRNWILQNWRPILMFFMPFIRTYIGIDPPPEQIGQSNEQNQTNQPNMTNTANDGTTAAPLENRIFVNRRGGVTNVDEGRDVNVTATYHNDLQRLNDSNVPRQMPEGADMAIFGEGATLRARVVGNITISETFGSQPNSQTDKTDPN